MTCQPESGVKPQPGARMANEFQRVERTAARGEFLARRAPRPCRP